MADADAPLFRRVLGERFDLLPPPIRQMHDIRTTSVAAGMSEVIRGSSFLARFIGWIARLPEAGPDIPVSVAFTRQNGAERWHRTFGASAFQSTLAASERRAGHVVERLGPMAFLLEIPADDQGLRMVLRGMSVLGIPVHRMVWPRISASERVEDGLFAFDVSVSIPVGGLVIRYRGRLQPPRAITT